MPFLPSTTLITDTLNLIKNDTPYIALFTASPNAGGGGTEVTGGSYARQSITFGAIASGSMSSSNTITFTGLPSATITHYAIFDAVSSGDMKGYGALSSTATVTSGDQMQFSAGTITVSLAGS